MPPLATALSRLRLAAKTLRCSVRTLVDRLEREPWRTHKLIQLALTAAEGEALAREHQREIDKQRAALHS
jgi:hypothetical protein